MWEIYDELIAGIPEDLFVEEFMIGSAWSQVRSTENKVGLALTVKGRCQNPIYQGNIIGDRIKDVAECVKSWNFTEASIGVAAINCYYNDLVKIAAFNSRSNIEGLDENSDNDNQDAFNALASSAAGKNVAVVGRFPHLEKKLSPICCLSVLERNPEHGDYPDSACEFIIAEQDMVFITGMTLTNKTLPRLLQLVKPGTRVIMVGPSVPISPVLYRYGVTDLDGFCVTDAQKIDMFVRRGDKTGIFKCGKKITVSKVV
ncbi:hypothetical protein GH810_02110 [Acetobacterium paludosum]|uniref:DUF364 domain-containing protein n=1 Tax=Acetobacterium paludosum TaxID=52693 RepID=A0A923KNG6_9FIRM|nr:DUF364 domain-containing protein [Acetobacterium paludosum]MBC3887104.1 hypothetical protein [Acetobacterium paludosum]